MVMDYRRSKCYIGIHWTNYSDLGDYIPLEVIGKTVFTTQEEAEAVLKERQGTK